MTQTELKKGIRSIIKDCYQTGVQDAYDNNSHFGEPNLWTSQLLALTQKAVEESEKRKYFEILELLKTLMTMDGARKATGSKNQVFNQGFKGGYNLQRIRIKRHIIDKYRLKKKAYLDSEVRKGDDK